MTQSQVQQNQIQQNQVQRCYREAQVRGASSVECVILMYDMLLSDLRKAIECLHSGDIEGRSSSVKHGLAVLGELQGNLQIESGGPVAQDLSHFYSLARAKMLEAHIKCREKIFEEIVKAMLEIRALWGDVRNSCMEGDSPALALAQAPLPWEVPEEPVATGAWSA